MRFSNLSFRLEEPGEQRLFQEQPMKPLYTIRDPRDVSQSPISAGDFSSQANRGGAFYLITSRHAIFALSHAVVGMSAISCHDDPRSQGIKPRNKLNEA